MTQNNQAYLRLQRHLNRQAVGFPATKSGVELKVLEHIFTPREAEIAACLSYRFEPLETVFARARHLVDSPGSLATILVDLQAKGGIETKNKNGTRCYCNAPLVVGMYEFQVDRLTPEFIRNFNAYTADTKFGVEFLSTELPQMRTIPIAKSINPQHHVSTYDEIKALLQQAKPPFAILECICRKKKAIEGKACGATNRQETCLAIGQTAQTVLGCGSGREISLDETMSIIDQNQKQGLVLQPSNTEKAEFICSCCGCCCGMLGIHKRLPIPVDFWASNYHAQVDASSCDGCGICQKRCQVGAVKVIQKKQPPAIDLNRCIGCGLCVPTCPGGSMALVQKATEVKPPATREDLYDIIMAHKKGGWGKLKLAGKLVIDAIRTGQATLLK